MEHPEIGFTILTQAGFKCPFCDKAAQLLDDRGFSFSLRPLKRAELIEAAARADMSTVPIIYHGVKKVGGYSELQAYLLRETP